MKVNEVKRCSLLLHLLLFEFRVILFSRSGISSLDHLFDGRMNLVLLTDADFVLHTGFADLSDYIF